mmetsp:Transcript_29189/g.86416  ORF Transcript_29189/g.86416 Transcript_29189/m.86416 type:complete len:267 (+) Transcript_29189:849-1649(+)
MAIRPRTDRPRSVEVHSGGQLFVLQGDKDLGYARWIVHGEKGRHGFEIGSPYSVPRYRQSVGGVSYTRDVDRTGIRVSPRRMRIRDHFDRAAPHRIRHGRPPAAVLLRVVHRRRNVVQMYPRNEVVHVGVDQLIGDVLKEEGAGGGALVSALNVKNSLVPVARSAGGWTGAGAATETETDGASCCFRSIGAPPLPRPRVDSGNASVVVRVVGRHPEQNQRGEQAHRRADVQPRRRRDQGDRRESKKDRRPEPAGGGSSDSVHLVYF